MWKHHSKVYSIQHYAISLQWLAIGGLFCPGAPVFSINKIDRQSITEILLKVALNTITLTIYVEAVETRKLTLLTSQSYIILVLTIRSFSTLFNFNLEVHVRFFRSAVKDHWFELFANIGQAQLAMVEYIKFAFSKKLN